MSAMIMLCRIQEGYVIIKNYEVTAPSCMQVHAKSRQLHCSREEQVHLNRQLSCASREEYRIKRKWSKQNQNKDDLLNIAEFTG